MIKLINNSPRLAIMVSRVPFPPNMVYCSTGHQLSDQSDDLVALKYMTCPSAKSIQTALGSRYS